jgi:hypothetical protein
MERIHDQRIPVDASYEDLVPTPGKETVAYSTIIKFPRSDNFIPKKDSPAYKRTPVGFSPVDEAILTVLADYPFSPVRKLS